MSTKLWCEFSLGDDATTTDSDTDVVLPTRNIATKGKCTMTATTTSTTASVTHAPASIAAKDTRENVIFKLQNRELNGNFSNSPSIKIKQLAFKQVPSRLSFCLKEIVPYCYLQSHVFMGLTACGQFLLSYKLSYDEENITNDYDFNTAYKYELFFWIYRPHHLLVKYYNVCLFDDHGVDNTKTVTMMQWLNDPRRLIVHGASENDHEDSYLTIVAVPKLGCLACKALRDEFSDGNIRCDALCVKCNLTIHTKYSQTDSDPRFAPRVNLNCPERIVMIANGFIHMLHVRLELSRPTTVTPAGVSFDTYLYKSTHSECHKYASVWQPDEAATRSLASCDSRANIVDRIIADFAECETPESPGAGDRNELVLNATGDSNVHLYAHLSPRIGKMTGLRNGIMTSELQMPICVSGSGAGGDKEKRSSEHLDMAAKAYEFSEDNEKCEKISTFRKRRLADKKYEFSEDNSENIVPFNRLRTAATTAPVYSGKPPTSAYRSYTRPSSIISPPSHSPPSYAEPQQQPHHHRSSPNHGFRSPCGSPVGNRCLRSPPGQFGASGERRTWPVWPRSALSPRQLSRCLTANGDLVVGLDMSPRRDVEPVRPVEVAASEKAPNCTKKFVRRYVEEDDATSVITSEEDDCISPGYHTSLPMEVHGSCYSECRMISALSYQKLRCPTVIVTQHSFDLETFTYHVANHLCEINQKQYGVFYDWACELVHVCPHSSTLTAVLMVHFTARDQVVMGSATGSTSTAASAPACVNCASNIDCVFHRHHFQCRTLFTWNLDTGEWCVLDYGDLLEVSVASSKTRGGQLSQVVRRLVPELAASLQPSDLLYAGNLRILDSCNEKSKDSLKDVANAIEFYRLSSKCLSDESEVSDMSDTDCDL